MTSLLESPCSPKTSTSLKMSAMSNELKMTAMSNDQLKLGRSATNGQLSPIDPSSNGHGPRSTASVLGNNGSRSNGRRGDEQQNNGRRQEEQRSNGRRGEEQQNNGGRQEDQRSNGRRGEEQRSNGRDESEARYCEFTRQSILSDPRFFLRLNNHHQYSIPF